jgi:hypothetical protein
MKRVVGYSMVLLALAAVFGSVSVASASGRMQIQEIFYNSPGPDTGSNTSLNGEWVMVENSTAKTKALKGWTLRDAAGHIYHFPSSYTLGPDQRVRIHTGKGSDTQANLYWGRSSYVWNNDKDTAKLKRPNGTVADKCSYNDPSTSFKIC